MNQRIKEDWVALLRYGDLPQIRDTLTSSRGNCCLGVLCELAYEEGIINRDDIDPRSTKYYSSLEADESFDGENWSITGLPLAVQKWADLDYSPWTKNNDALADINDQGATFKQIADIIERDF